MERVTPQQFNDLVQRSSILHTKKGKHRVYLTADQHIVKMFHPKRGYKRRVKRFVRCAEKLKQLGFRSVAVKEVKQCENKSIYIKYPILQGLNVKELYQKDPNLVLEKLPEFISRLHDQGVYFKDFHPGNFIYMNNNFGLIDVHNTNFTHRKLSLRRRIKNFENFFYSHASQGVFSDEFKHKLVDAYLAKANLSPRNKQKFFQSFQ